MFDYMVLSLFSLLLESDFTGPVPVSLIYSPPDTGFLVEFNLTILPPLTRKSLVDVSIHRP